MPRSFFSREAGAVLNKKNRSALKAALDTITSVLKNAGIDLAAEDDTADQTDTKEAAGFSVADLATLLQAALDETREAPDNPDKYVPPLRIVDLFDDTFIYCEGWANSTYYRVAYSVTDDGIVTLQQPEFVIRKVSYIVPGATASEAYHMPLGDTPGILLPSEPLRLIESAIAADGTARIKLIDADRWGSSGFYSADVLKRDGSAAFPAGTQMFIDHDTPAEEAQRPEGTLTRLAAVLTSNAQFERDPKYGAGLFAMVRVRDAMKDDLDNIAPYIGTSIKASGTYTIGEAQGKKGPIITALKPSKLNRVDFVTMAGAGGKVLPLFESLRNRVDVSDNVITSDHLSSVVVIENSIGDHEMTEEQIRALVAETMRATLGTALTEALAPITAQQARITESIALREAETIVRQHLGAIAGLPAMSVDRLVPAITATAKLTEAGALDRAALLASADQIVRGEAQYIEALGGARIIGLGESGASNIGGVDPADDEKLFTEELTGIFGRWGMSESGAKIAAQGRIS